MENRMYEEQQPVQEQMVRNSGRAWIFGALLITIGGVLFLQNTGLIGQDIGNWWALFLLVPALAGYSAAYTEQRKTGSLSRKTRAGLIFSVLLTMLTAILVFNLDTEIYGPILLMCVGLGIFLQNIKQS